MQAVFQKISFSKSVQPMTSVNFSRKNKKFRNGLPRIGRLTG